MLTEGQRIARAERAQRLLEDDLLKEAFATLEEAYIQMWRGSDAADPAKREEAFYLIRNLQLLRKQLSLVLQDGKAAVHDLEIARRKQRSVA